MLRRLFEQARDGGSEHISPPSRGFLSRLLGGVMSWRDQHILFFTTIGFCGMVTANSDKFARIPFEIRALFVVISGGALIYAAALMKTGK